MEERKKEENNNKRTHKKCVLYQVQGTRVGSRSVFCTIAQGHMVNSPVFSTRLQDFCYIPIPFSLEYFDQTSSSQQAKTADTSHAKDGGYVSRE